MREKAKNFHSNGGKLGKKNGSDHLWARAGAIPGEMETVREAHHELPISQGPRSAKKQHWERRKSYSLPAPGQNSARLEGKNCKRSTLPVPYRERTNVRRMVS